MIFFWLDWQNPVAIWWIFLSSVSVCNLLLWGFTAIYFRKADSDHRALLWLSAGYTFVCAFRSFLPRADVQRIVLFDTWFSSVLVGRTVATIGELCFVAQWALVLNRVGREAGDNPVLRISRVIVPLIAMAECFSWYAVITTHYLGNTIEESTWAATYTLILFALARLWPKLTGALKYAAGVGAVGSVFYVLFMVLVDVPMYFGRWQADSLAGKPLLGLMAGFADLNGRWHVTHDIQEWHTEIPWMSLYFSAAVWVSIALCYVPLRGERLARFLRR